MINRAVPISPFEALAPPWQLPQLDANLASPVTALNDSSLGYVNGLAVDVGTVNNYVVTLPVGVPTAYQPGMTVVLFPSSTNTGSCSIRVAPLGSSAILSPSGAPLLGGEISKGVLCSMVYSASAPVGFRIVGACPITQNIGNVTTNQTVDCTGGTSIFVTLGITTAVNIALTLNNVSYLVPIMVRFVNNQATTRTFSLLMTDTSGATVTCFSFEAGSLANLTNPGRSVPNAQFLIFGNLWFGALNAYFIGALT